MQEIRYRWVEDPDEEYCEIVEEGCYEDGEPNGWFEIMYIVDDHGRSIPVSKWDTKQ